MGEKVVVDKIWFMKDKGTIQVGFNKSFLRELSEGSCWHIMPANNRRVKEKLPLLTVESSDELVSIPSPVSANVYSFSDKARNFPEKLNEDDVVIELRESDTKSKAKVADVAQVQARQAVPVQPGWAQIAVGNPIDRGGNLAPPAIPNIRNDRITPAQQAQIDAIRRPQQNQFFTEEQAEQRINTILNPAARRDAVDRALAEVARAQVPQPLRPEPLDWLDDPA